MSNIVVKGTQEFLGIEIPIIEGGFGEDKRCLTDKTIAEIHQMENKNIRARITSNIKRFKENIDYIDIKRVYDVNTLVHLGYAKQSITQAKNIYLLSERGYAKLIKIMDNDLAWEIHDELMDEYFAMRKVIKENHGLKEQLLLQLFSNDALTVANAHKQLVELETKPLLNKIEEDKPLVEFSNSVAQSSDSIDVGTFAKLIKDEGIKLGRNKLFDWLRTNDYLMKNNQPYQKYVDNNYFEIIEQPYKTPYGDKINIKTLITGIGQIKLMEKIRTEFGE